MQKGQKQHKQIATKFEREPTDKFSDCHDDQSKRYRDTTTKWSSDNNKEAKHNTAQHRANRYRALEKKDDDEHENN
eukprot:3863113-Prorocentrum_lima.AAC.1